MKKVLVILLVVGLIFSLVSMGVLAQERPVIKLGCAVALTGRLARGAACYVESYNLAVDYINSHGGVKIGNTTYNFEIIYYDDASDPSASATLVEKLVTQDHVNFLIGPYTSGITFADSAIAEKYQIPMITAAGASENIYSRGFKYVFGLLSPAGRYFAPIFKMCTDVRLTETFTPLPSKVALLYADGKFDISCAEGTKKMIEEKYPQFQLVLYEKYTVGQTDFTTLLTKVKNSGADILLNSGHETETLAIVQQLEELRANLNIVAFTIGTTYPDFREVLGADANYFYGTPNWAAEIRFTDPIFESTADYVKLHTNTYSYTPNYHTSAGTAILEIYKLAIEKAGTLNSKAVRDEIAAFDQELQFGHVSFMDNGQISRDTVLIQIQNNEIVLVYPSENPSPLYPMPHWSER